MENTIFMIYLPTEYCDSYMELQGLLKEKRAGDRSLRTKVQIGMDDFILITKTVGEMQWTMRSPEFYGLLPPGKMDKGEDKCVDYDAEEREKEKERADTEKGKEEANSLRSDSRITSIIKVYD